MSTPSNTPLRNDKNAIKWTELFIETLTGLFQRDNGILPELPAIEVVPHESHDGYWAFSDGGRRATVLGDLAYDIGTGYTMKCIDYSSCHKAQEELDIAAQLRGLECSEEQLEGFEYLFDVTVGFYDAGNSAHAKICPEAHLSVTVRVNLDAEYGGGGGVCYEHNVVVKRQYLYRRPAEALAFKMWSRT